MIKSKVIFQLNLCFVLILCSCSVKSVSIQEVIDGDTLKINESRTVRLVQIDTPELQGGECYAEGARAELKSLLAIEPYQSKGVTKELRTSEVIRLERDPISSKKDKYGRELAYVFKGDMNINLELVKRGAAAPYFYDGQKGKYTEALLAAVHKAQAEKIGVWGACPSAILDSTLGFSSGNLNVAASETNDGGVLVSGTGTNCDPNYAGCIPMYPPDLDCADIRALGLAPIHRIAGDPHRLDRDGDGMGCE